MTLEATQPLTETSTRSLAGGKCGRRLGLTTLPPSMSRMSENVGVSSSRNPKGLHGLYRENFTFTILPYLFLHLRYFHFHSALCSNPLSHKIISPFHKVFIPSFLPLLQWSFQLTPSFPVTSKIPLPFYISHPLPTSFSIVLPCFIYLFIVTALLHQYPFSLLRQQLSIPQSSIHTLSLHIISSTLLIIVFRFVAI
jgi:hypothetical protein